MKRTKLNNFEKLEQERWNHCLVKAEDYVFNREPNKLLQSVLFKKKCRNKTALDISMGQGRNAVWLAKRGFKTTGFDIAKKAMSLALKYAKIAGVEIETVYSSSRTFDFLPEQWDLILSCYAGCLNYMDMKALKNSLRKNGMFVFEFFHEDYGKQIGRENFGCSESEVQDLFISDKRFEILYFKIVEDIADYGLQKAKLIKMVVKRVL